MIAAQALIDKFQQALDEEWGYIWGKIHEKWTEAKQEKYARDYANDEKRALSVKYGGKWAGHWVADCSGLFKWAYQQLGTDIYHGSNTIYNRYCSAKGTLRNGKKGGTEELQPGTAVFTGNATKKGHVGLYIGNGWVIEAAGTQEGVIRSKVTATKWKYWGELKEVAYDQEGGSMPTDETRPTLRKGSRGEYVQLLQTALINRGYNCGAYGADGVFGTSTDLAVRRFQEASGLVVDGIVGPNTWAALDTAAAAPMTYSITITGLSKDQVTSLLKAYPTADVTQEGR